MWHKSRHLTCNNKNSRKVQITEIDQDTKHLINNFTGLNLISLGDFNDSADKLTAIPLTRAAIEQNTWRKNALVPYTSQIDHVLHSVQLELEVRLEETESDHQAMICTVQKLGACKGVSYPTERSNLSRLKTKASDPRSWRNLPDIPTYGFLGPNKSHWTVKNEEEHREPTKKYREKIFKEGLETILEWK